MIKGREFPEWFQDIPVLLPGEDWYLHAYWALDSERIGGGSQTVGRIPWSRTLTYGAYHGLVEPMLSAFWEYVIAMDSGYREHMRIEHDRFTRMNKPKKAAKKPEARYAR